MARNSHDLFEVLGAHLGRRSSQARGKQKSQAQPKSRSKSRAGQGEVATPMEIGRKLTGWIGGLAGVRPKGRARVAARTSRAAGSRGLGFGGSFVSAAVVVSLAAGFMAGRWTDAATAGADLRQIPKGQTPGPLSSKGKLVTLTRAQEVERMSAYAYKIFAYPGAERSKASRLANWLVNHGVRHARLRAMERKDSSPVWVVVCYVPAAEDRRVFAILQNLDAPSFEPRLGSMLARLNPKPDPVGA